MKTFLFKEYKENKQIKEHSINYFLFCLPLFIFYSWKFNIDFKAIKFCV